MLADAEKAALDAAWQPARRAGVLGTASIEELWEHTAGFASAVCSAFSAECSTWNGRILDAGTGAGVPGVLLACQLPCAELTLVDGSDRRLDHVRAAVRALGLGDRIRIIHGRMDDLAHETDHRAMYDVAVARLLADPAEAAELILPCVRPGGIAVVSCRDDQVPAWRQVAAAVRGASDVVTASEPAGAFVTVSISGLLAQELPRRPAARARTPLI